MRKLLLVCISLLFVLSVMAQKTIRGKVTHGKGNVVSGATVAVKGGNMATQTNSEGSFP